MKNRSITLFDIVLNEIYLSIINASDIYHTEVPYMKDFQEILDQEINSVAEDFDALKRGRIKQVSNTIEKVIQHVTKETKNT